MDDETFEEPEPFEGEEEIVEEAVVEEEAPAASEEALVSSQALPLTLSVEVGRVRMTADKLLNLQPGNLVELSSPVSGGVTLVANGAPVGRGELVQVGDVVGVRVTELG